jgi:alpha-L-fucosidase 2
VVALTRSDFPVVAAHSSVHTTWRVGVPGATPPGESDLTGTASYHSLRGVDTATGTAPVSVPYPSLPAAFGNVGVSLDTSTDVANFDGGGNSLSAQALAVAGVSAGGTISHGGTTFTWPNVQTGQNDNVLADGQAFRLTGSGAVHFLVAATQGPAAGTGTLVYSDGSTEPFSLGSPDWFNAPPAGSDPAITMTYRNRPGNTQQPRTITVFHVSALLTAEKSLTGVILPTIGDMATPFQPAIHVFAISAG